MDRLTSQAFPAGSLQDAQTVSLFFSERPGEVESEYEDIWTMLLLGNPRWNLVWNLEEPTDCMRSWGLPGPWVPKHTHAHMHVLPSIARRGVEQKMLSVSRTLLSLQKKVPVCSACPTVIPPPPDLTYQECWGPESHS